MRDGEGGRTPEACQPHDRWCRRRNGSAAKNHKTDGVERKNAYSERRTRNCQAVSHLWAKHWQSDTEVQVLKNTSWKSRVAKFGGRNAEIQKLDVMDFCQREQQETL